jgi:outer membrane protein assembly factor BamA
MLLAGGWLRSAFVGLLLSTGCHRVPEGRSAVLDVTVRGAHKVDDDEILDKIATMESPRFLGLFPGVVYDYSVFNHNILQKDLARVEALYRSKGYYDAHARAGRVHRLDDRRVRVEILVVEGEPVTVRRVRIEGLEGVPAPIVDLARRSAERVLEIGAPFDEGAFDKALGAVRRTLIDRGWAYAQVKNDATIDLVERKVDVLFTVTPGPPCVYGPMTIEGLGDLPEAPVKRALDIAPGEPFSEHELEVARQAILDLGVFASVVVEPDLPDPPRRAEHGEGMEVPIKVRLEGSRLRTIRFGGGVEFDALKTDVHGIFGWENRNFLGGMRSLAISVKPGVVLYPLRVGKLEMPDRFLPEGRVRLDFRQPGFIEARTNAFVRPELNVQALLLDPNPPPGSRVIGYAESRNSIGVDRIFASFYGGISHNVHVAYPFAYVGERDPTLGTLVISYPELVMQLDLRNSRVNTRSGAWFGNTLQTAGGPFGGLADDVKVQPDARGYIPLSRRVVLAMRGSVGFLFARNYGSDVPRPPSLFDPSAELTRSYQLMFFRGFFSGGPNSNRGYPLRGVSPHAYVPFISPEVEEQRLLTTCGGGLDCRSPVGGFSLWEASLEVRFDVAGPLAIATFCDASDVSPHTMDIRLDHPHLSCGAGGRYETPVGPIRLDIGYRIPGMQVIGGLTPDERVPQTFPFGIPIAVSVGIGEAF